MRLPAAAIFLALVASPAFGQGGISGSAHDFRADSWNTGAGTKNGEICGVCHIPHVEGRAAVGTGRVGEPLLWGRDLSTVTYTLYTSPSLTGTITQPSGATRLCLGCHDGTVALEEFHTQTGGSTTIPTSARVPGLASGQDFGADHPVSVVYDVTDTGLLPTNTAWAGPGAATIADVLEVSGADLLVQCSSCHDVHNQDVAAGAPKLLRIDIAVSEICLACHDK